MNTNIENGIRMTDTELDALVGRMHEWQEYDAGHVISQALTAITAHRALESRHES